MWGRRQILAGCLWGRPWRVCLVSAAVLGWVSACTGGTGATCEPTARETYSDGVLDYRITYTHDADGKRLRDDHDDGADGTIDRSVTYEYSADGTLLATDQGPWRETYTYDSNGNRTSILYEWEEDGLHSGTAEWTFAYDGDCKLVLEEHDWDVTDGVINTRTVYEYVDGLLVEEAYEASPIDDIVDARIVYAYDERGLRLSSERYNRAGYLWSRTTYSHDADGNLTSEAWDDRADGTTDQTVHYRYDDHGNLVASETDSGNDGTIDHAQLMTYACS